MHGAISHQHSPGRRAHRVPLVLSLLRRVSRVLCLVDPCCSPLASYIDTFVVLLLSETSAEDRSVLVLYVTSILQLYGRLRGDYTRNQDNPVLCN